MSLVCCFICWCRRLIGVACLCYGYVRTNNHDVISAIINARNYEREWERKHGLYARPLRELCRREVNEWAIVQKDLPGLEIVTEEYKKRLSRWGVVPDIFVFPPKMSIYATMVPPTEMTYKEIGQSTSQSFAAGPGALGTFRGINVYETRMFDVYENELPIDLLRRQQQIGEYYIMNDPHRYDSEMVHPASHRDIIIYNEDLDNWSRITFREAVRKAINVRHAPDPGAADEDLFHHAGGLPPDDPDDEHPIDDGTFPGFEVAGTLNAFIVGTLVPALQRAVPGAPAARGNEIALRVIAAAPGAGAGVDFRPLLNGDAGLVGKVVTREVFDDTAFALGLTSWKIVQRNQYFTAVGGQCALIEPVVAAVAAIVEPNNVGGAPASTVAAKNLRTLIEALAGALPGGAVGGGPNPVANAAEGEIIRRLVGSNARNFRKAVRDNICAPIKRMAGKPGWDTKAACEVFTKPGQTITFRTRGDALRFRAFMGLQARSMVLRWVVNAIIDGGGASAAGNFDAVRTSVMELKQERDALHEAYATTVLTKVAAMTHEVRDRRLRAAARKELEPAYGAAPAMAGFARSRTTGRIGPASEAMIAGSRGDLQRVRMRSMRIGANTRPMGAFFSSIEHLKEATRGMDHYAVPSFAAAGITGQHRHGVASGGDRMIDVPAAHIGNNGYHRHDDGTLCVYETACAYADGINGATFGDKRALYSPGRRTERDWAGVDVRALMAAAGTGGAAGAATAQRGAAMESPLAACARIVAAADAPRAAPGRIAGRTVTDPADYRTTTNDIYSATRYNSRHDDGVEMALDGMNPAAAHAASRGGGGGGGSPHAHEVAYARRVLEHAKRIGVHPGSDAAAHHVAIATQNPPQMRRSAVGAATEERRQAEEDFRANGANTRYVLERGGRVFANRAAVQLAFGNAGAHIPNLGTALAVPVSSQHIDVLLDNSLRVPYDILLLRPFMEYSMSSAVLMKGGYDTGATFVGHSDFILGDDVVSKLHYGNFTFYSKSVVTNPKNLIIARNIFCQGYTRGSGVDMFERDYEAARAGRTRVKGYDPDGGEHTASLISVLIPYGSGDRLPNPLDIEAHKTYDPTTALQQPRIQQVEANGVKPAAFMDAAYVTKLFSLHEYSRNRSDPASEPFVEFERTQNTICYRGHQFSYCPTTKQHTAVTVNTGHWGPNVYPGCGRVRAGEMKYLEKCDYRSAISVAR